MKKKKRKYKITKIRQDQGLIKKKKRKFKMTKIKPRPRIN